MKPVHFEGCNVEIAKDQPEYLTLPAHVSGDEHGVVTSCWRLGPLERLRVLFTGRLFLQAMTHRKPLQPQKPSATNPLDQEERNGP